MQGPIKTGTRSRLIRAAMMAVISIAFGIASCNSQQPAQAPPPSQSAQPQRFAMQGRVVSVDKADNKVTIQHGDIPGFMGAMTMPYAVKNPQLLDSVKPEDKITADVVTDSTSVWLENIAVVGKASQPDQAKTPPSKDSHPASPAPAKN